MNKYTSPSPSGGGKTHSPGPWFSRTALCPYPLASHPSSHPTMAQGKGLGDPRTSLLPGTSSKHPQLPLWAPTMTTSSSWASALPPPILSCPHWLWVPPTSLPPQVRDPFFHLLMLCILWLSSKRYSALRSQAWRVVGHRKRGGPAKC